VEVLDQKDLRSAVTCRREVGSVRHGFRGFVAGQLRGDAVVPGERDAATIGYRPIVDARNYGIGASFPALIGGAALAATYPTRATNAPCSR
jgi:hypothetical protein